MPTCTLYSACPSLNSSFVSLTFQTKLLLYFYIFISVKHFVILYCPCQTPGATLISSLSLNLENRISHQVLLILLPLHHCTLFYPLLKATLNPVPYHFLSGLLQYILFKNLYYHQSELSGVSHLFKSFIISFMSFKGKFKFLDLGKHVPHELCPSILDSSTPHQSCVLTLSWCQTEVLHFLQERQAFPDFPPGLSVFSAFAFPVCLSNHSRFCSGVTSSWKRFLNQAKVEPFFLYHHHCLDLQCQTLHNAKHWWTLSTYLWNKWLKGVKSDQYRSLQEDLCNRTFSLILTLNS